MINLCLSLNNAKKLARDLDKIIELTEGRYMSLVIIYCFLVFAQWYSYYMGNN